VSVSCSAVLSGSAWKGRASGAASSRVTDTGRGDGTEALNLAR